MRRNDHFRGFVAESGAQPIEIILAVIVVLIEHGDLGIRQVLEDVIRVDVRFDAVAWQPHHGPRKVLGIVPLVGAGGNEQLRHLVFVQIVVDRHVRWRAERTKQHEYLVLLDQLAHLLHSLWRTIAVVAADIIDFAAVDAALFVDHGKVGSMHFAVNAVG